MNVLKPHLQTTIRTLLEAGATQREIERVTGIDRKTIRGYQRRLGAVVANSPGVATDPAGQIPPPRPPTLAANPMPAGTVSACEPHRGFIEEQLRLQRNAMAIYQDLVDRRGYTGAYNSVKRFAARLRRREPEQFDRLSFLPGEEMQVDYGQGAPTRVPGTDRYRRPRLFVATLRYSRRSFRRVLWRSSQQAWAELHEQAWRYFGGSCRYVVIDNLKEGVIEPDLYETELNAVYAATLAHYGVVADPARVRDPNRKGSVENAIGHTQGTALKGRRFESIEEQNTFLEHWETRWAASRIHGAARRQVQAMFEEERPHLQELPLLGMRYFREEQRTVYDDGCVRIDHSSYAARPARIGAIVLVRIFERSIEIRDLQTKALLRSHARAECPGSLVLPEAERIFNPSRETRRILAQAQEIGADAYRLCQLLFAIEGRVGQRKLWGIVGLTKHYPRRLIDAACARAIDDGIHSYKHVKTITEALVAKAVAYQATLQGYDVRHIEADTELARYAVCSPAEQAALLRALLEPDLLVLDDLFLARRISDHAAELLQTVVHQRYKHRRSIIVTSNRIVQDWGKYLGDQTMATTILDRLMHRAVMLEFEGKSYRLKEAASRLALNSPPTR